MNPGYFSILFIFLMLFIISQEEKKENALRIIKKKKSKGRFNMNEIINMYLEKNCAVTVSGYSQIRGKISSVKENWIVVETKTGNEVINLDYVVSIKEITK